MKTLQLTAALVVLASLGWAANRASAAEADGLALAIVYDTSGSMKEQVKDANGKSTSKFVIANRALAAIAQRVQGFATNTAAGPRRISAGLFVFQGNGARQAIPFGPFDAAALQRWAKAFTSPEGGTPLGNALTAAAETLLKSGLTRKHILIITDGVNTVGPDPAATLPKARQKAEQQGAPFSVHFVAFDVDANVFAGVKKLGATVVGAANETQLNEQLGFILEKKILLEEEEAPAKK
jgi:Mg-chelatase subunit ChlD